MNNIPAWIKSTNRIGRLEAQKQIDDVYGKGEWKVIEFKGGHEALTVEHRCGLEKTVSRFSQFKLGKTKCECQHDYYPESLVNKRAEKTSNRIKELTGGEYSLVSFESSKSFIVRHNSEDCGREFETSSSRFFSRGQRCGCNYGRGVK